ncbi:hypothetical protein Cmtc_09360 [Cupriavidus sp. TKC]|nr:hypothetical protein Cmtc_09360 [Cupriavidus sp. TKC]
MVALPSRCGTPIAETARKRQDLPRRIKRWTQEKPLIYAAYVDFYALSTGWFGRFFVQRTKTA